ncbi:MAG TPA: peptide ABC transporter substrate-binding protein [Dehalococcoidia bacterium]
MVRVQSVQALWWRVFAFGLLAALLLLAAGACGGGDEDEGGAATGDRRQGGELVVHGNTPESLDPHYSSFAQDISLHRMIWRGLYTLDKDNRPQPAMADGMPQVSSDGKTYTIKVKSGLKWSDGQPLTAKDFELGLKRTCNPDVGGQYQYVLVNVVGCDDFYNNKGPESAVGVTAKDDTTLEIRLQEPQPTFTIILSLWMTFPAPKHLISSSGAEWPTDPSRLAYNGPYRLVQYTPNDRAVLEPNPNWIGDVKPTLDRLVIRFIDDYAVADNAFRSGELQFARVDVSQLRAIQAEFGDQYAKSLKPSTRGLEMQMEHPVLSKLDVRLALARAINREQLNEVVTQGANEPTTSWIPEVTSGVELGTFDDVIGYNPDKAKEHLAKAGYPNGQGFPELTILVGDTAAARATAEFLQQSFRQVLNINTRIEVVDARTRSQRFSTEQFELFPGGWIQDYPDMENWILGQFDTNGSLNHFNCSHPEIDRLVEQARFNTNEEQRQEQYRQIERLIIENVCGIAPYWHENDHYLIKSNVVGMKENISGQDAFQAGDWAVEYWGLRK